MLRSLQKKLVVLTTEWLPLLQTCWRDGLSSAPLFIFIPITPTEQCMTNDLLLNISKLADFQYFKCFCFPTGSLIQKLVFSSVPQKLWFLPSSPSTKQMGGYITEGLIESSKEVDASLAMYQTFYN